MGKHNEWRDFFVALFPQCFKEELPVDTHFDMCIIDMMQFLAKMKGDTVFKPRETTERAVRTIFDYANIDNHSDRPIIDKALVLLLDTAKNVPKCKATTQIARDTAGNTGVDEGGDTEVGGDEAEGEENDGDSAIMTEALYNELLEEMGLSPGDYMIHADMRKVPERMTPKMIWRSNNLKWQLNSMLVTSLLKNLVVKQGKVAIIDDGVVLGGGNEGYRQLREQMIRDYRFENRSAYEKEMLVSFLVTHTLTHRYVLHHDGQFKRLPESGIGEADVKIGNYISRENEGNPNPIRRYLIVSQDTDIPFILLAHMKRLIDPETGEVDEDIEVWVDTQTPSDRSKLNNRAYRYVNIKALYNAIIGFFREEYPAVANPIETLLFLVNALDTDFTTRLGHKYLGVTRRVMWNVFSETHYQAKKGGTSEGYVLFGKKVVRSKMVHYSARAFHLLSGEAIRVVETPETREYRIVMNLERCEQFLYLVTQLVFVRDMTKLKMLNKTSVQFYYEDPSVLLIAAQDLTRSMARYNSEEEAVASQSIVKLMGKSFILPSSPTQMPKKTRDISPGISFASTDPVHRCDKAVMATLVKKTIPEGYGIPSREQMKARLARLDWVLNYIQNGTVLRGMASVCDTVSPLDKTQSLYGWQRVEMEASGVNLNSSYHTQLLKECLLGEMPITVHATHECDTL